MLLIWPIATDDPVAWCASKSVCLLLRAESRDSWGPYRHIVFMESRSSYGEGRGVGDFFSLYRNFQNHSPLWRYRHLLVAAIVLEFEAAFAEILCLLLAILLSVRFSSIFIMITMITVMNKI